MTTLGDHRNAPIMDEPGLRRCIATALRQWPSAGIAVAVVRENAPPQFLSHGIADSASGRPISEARCSASAR
jgi:hypothetical protein